MLTQSCPPGQWVNLNLLVWKAEEKYSLVDPILPTRGVGEPELLPNANDLPGDGLKEDEVVSVVLSDLRVHKVVPAIQVWIFE